jgi:hypothetical protein
MPRVVITGDERRPNQIAAVEDSGQWRMVVPFSGLSIKDARLVGEDRLVCQSSYPDNRGRDATLCLIDWQSGLEIARRTMWIAGTIHVTNDARFILVVAEIYLHVMRADDLSTVAEGNTVRWETKRTPAGRWRGRLFQSDTPASRGTEDPVILHTAKTIHEDQGGRLFFLCCNAGPQRRIRYAICHIDPTDGTVSAAEIANTSGQWLWFSPSKRFALARHVRTLAYDDGHATKAFFGFGKRPARHPDALPDGRLRFGRALELWETDPPTLKAILVVRMDAIQAVTDAAGKPVPGAWVRFARESPDRPADNVAPRWKPLPGEIRAHPERQLWAMLHDRMNHISAVAWEPDERGFWIQFGRWSKTMVLFRRTGIDGSLSPLFGFARFRDTGKTVRQDFAGFPDAGRLAIQAASGRVYLQRAWCESPAAFRLVTEDEDGFDPSIPPPEAARPPEDAVARALRPTRRHVVTLADFSRDAVAACLDGLARDVGSRLGTLVWREGFRIIFEMAFVVAGTTVPEAEFFRLVYERRLPVAPELRSLLTAYLAAQALVVGGPPVQEQIWGPDGMGAFGPAMQALLLLDPGSKDVFREYLARRDGEHEVFSTDVIMKFAVAAHGWNDPGMQRLGVYFALIRERDGRRAPSGLLNEYGLLDAAEGTVDAASLAAMIADEINGFVLESGDDSLTPACLLAALAPSLHAGAYGQAVLRAIGPLP